MSHGPERRPEPAELPRPLPDPEAAEALARLLTRRHSCRAFRPDPVPREVIERILATAQKVPSWCNAQPWQVIVTSGAETDAFRDMLLRAVETEPHAPDFPFPERYEGVYRERRRECGWQLYEAVGVARGDREGSARQMRENFRLFGAPHCAIVTTPAALGVYGAVDCGAWVTAFCLAATAEGVATIPQAAVASYAPAVRRHFGIGEDRKLVCAISFGWEDESHPANAFRTTRAPLDEVVTWRG